MSQHGYPSSGAPPYPQGQGSTPYPTQNTFPELQKPGAQGYQQGPYPGQGPAPSHPVPAPRNINKQDQAQPPFPQDGSPYPQQGQGQPPYPQSGSASGQPPYPQGQQAPYPQQGQGSTPPARPGPPPRPASGPPPRPATGPNQGSAPYPSPGQTPYPNQGQPPYGQAANPAGQPGPGGYPNQGQPPPGQSPYPNQPPQVHPPQGQGPYPGQGQPPQHQGPYPGQGQPPQHQGPYPGQGQPPQNQGPYPGQGQPPGHGYPGQQGHPPAGTQQGYTAPPVGAGGRVTRPGTDEFKSRVEIRVECKNLLNKDIMSKSDPCACIYMMRAGRWEEVGRTENVVNCLDPRFARSFVVNYFFEEVQKVLIAVYDIDNQTPQLTDDDFLGQLETTLGQLVSNTPYTASLLLKNGRKAGQGTITVRTEEIKEGCESVLLTFRASKLDNKDFFGKSDPYLELLRATSDGSWQMIHRTEVIRNNLNPSWRPFQLSLQNLCGGNKQQKIKIDCYDWDSDGSHDFIGSCTTTFEEMSKAAQQEVSWACVNPSKKAKKKNYSGSGTILLTSCKIMKEYSFLDYIMGGMQINFTVGIDFTASNGNPSKSTSLHYINPYQPNEYMAAIKSVGEVCQDYDTDKLFPVLGFGAKMPPTWQVSHEFAVNFNPQNPYCQGIDGVLQAYFNCIQNVQLYGPTNASPIINHVARFATTAQSEEGTKGAHAYFILLLLTDGVLSDMSNTKTAIVQASKLPMSLIIVGVGQADFTDMEILDGDNGVLKGANGEPVKRDIVQFVPFRDFKNSSPVELARHVLAEVPKQVTDYYKMRNMQPNKKPETKTM